MRYCHNDPEIQFSMKSTKTGPNAPSLQSSGAVTATFLSYPRTRTISQIHATINGTPTIANPASARVRRFHLAWSSTR